jgi:phosphoenolpyruvate phosphomutase
VYGYIYDRVIVLFQGPVVIVPTKYYTVPMDHFRDLGVSLVIWANHNMRASVAAMQQTTQQIYKDQSLVNVEGKV